ncbi:unnamed protein product [Oppiella nova]|uniref:Uncharacterized protein n=1 Tax=Oppiella nova TaxID=334625 RepID=A0A7R9LNT1_9ACAR|nr:unnamed protein product [Oppiella nova]CAG2165490.1 unnamed protein product [Oppiella nova]
MSCQYSRQHLFDGNTDDTHDHKQTHDGHMAINPGKHHFGRSYALPDTSSPHHIHDHNEHMGHQHRHHSSTSEQHLFDGNTDDTHDHKHTHDGHMAINPGKHHFGRSYALPDTASPHHTHDHNNAYGTPAPTPFIDIRVSISP